MGVLRRRRCESVEAKVSRFSTCRATVGNLGEVDKGSGQGRRWQTRRAAARARGGSQTSGWRRRRGARGCLLNTHAGEGSFGSKRSCRFCTCETPARTEPGADFCWPQLPAQQEDARPKVNATTLQADIAIRMKRWLHGECRVEKGERLIHQMELPLNISVSASHTAQLCQAL
eukprot:5689017-Pleurochrysis_carterae.AAC.3